MAASPTTPVQPPPDSRRYWHAGGAVISRSGPIPRERALALEGFYFRTAIAEEQAGQREFARHASTLGLELFAAINAQAAHARQAVSA